LPAHDGGEAPGERLRDASASPGTIRDPEEEPMQRPDDAMPPAEPAALHMRAPGITRRQALRWVALAVGGMAATPLLAACGSQPPAPKPTAPAAAPKADAKPTEAPKPAAEAKPAAPAPEAKPAAPAAKVATASGQRLVVLVPSSPPGLDPQSASGIAGAVSFDTYSTLISFEINEQTGVADQNKYVPELAESWEIAPDRKSVTFKLRPDATFTDGSPVTAEDVRFSFERSIKGKLGWGTTQLAAGNITSVEQLQAVDDRTFRVTYPDGMGRYSFRNFGTVSLTVMSKKYIEANATADDPYAGKHVQRQPMGSGNYVVDSWNPGEALVLKAKADHWSKVTPAYAEIMYRFVPESQTRLLLLKSGQADIAQGLAPKDWQQLRDDPSIQVRSVPRNQDTLVLRWNPTIAPFDDPNIREAIVKAIPYRAIIDQTVYGFGTEVKNLIGVNTYGYRPLPAFETNVEEARRLVKASKYLDSAQFSLLVNSDIPERVAAAVMIQSALRDIGIGMEIQQLPLAAYQERCNARQLPVNLHSMGPWFDDALYWAYWMFETSSATNYISYSNPTLDAAVKEALFIPQEDRAQYDPRLKAVIEDTLVKDHIAAPLYQVNWTIAAKKRIGNLIYWPWASFESKDLKPV
jgi:peptide/nickel transport system substrate-binding protein